MLKDFVRSVCRDLLGLYMTENTAGKVVTKSSGSAFSCRRLEPRFRGMGMSIDLKSNKLWIYSDGRILLYEYGNVD